MMGRKQQPRIKHIPQRTCVVCRSKVDKRRLTRVVNTPEGGVQIDPTGKMNGRGAYLCDKVDCWQKAVQSSILDTALRTSLTEIDRERIRAAMPH